MFLDKLLATTLLCASMGISNADIREPNRTLSVENYQIINATSSTVMVDYYPEDTTITVNPNETVAIGHETNGTLNIYTNTKFDGYCFFAPDNEDLVTINWSANTGPYSWTTTIVDYEPATGIGFYNRKNLSTDNNYYYKTTDFEIYNQSNQMDAVKILPEGSAARLYKEDGSYTQVTSDDLVLFRKKVEGTTILATALGINVSQQVGAETYLIVAMNFMYGTINAFQPSELANMAQKSLATMSGYMFYYSGYTNRLRFVSGNLPFYPNDKGYIDPNYITDIDTGYIGFNQNGDQSANTFSALKAGTDLMEKAIGVAVAMFSFVIFPGVTVGTLLLIPLLAMLLIWLIRLLKRGG